MYGEMVFFSKGIANSIFKKINGLKKNKALMHAINAMRLIYLPLENSSAKINGSWNIYNTLNRDSPDKLINPIG